MRYLLLALILANLLFFAWGKGWFGSFAPTETAVTEPQRLNQQIKPERIKLRLLDTETTAATCRRLEAPDPAVVERLRQGGLQVTVMPPPPSPFAVVISGLPDEAAARKKAAELTDLGVVGLELQTTGNGYTITLGVFGDEEQARAQLSRLNALGVRSAQINKLPPPPAPLEVRGAGDTMTRLLASVPNSACK